MQDQSLLTDLDQVESLILSLYQPNPPEVISRTQAILSQLQGAQQAWSLARHLLTRPDEKVKFFGALTIIVKLNKESSSLDAAQATELLVSLISWYLDSHCFENGGTPLVAKKLSSAIATYFLHFYGTWPRFLRHLILCLASHQSIHPDAIDGSADTAMAIVALTVSQLQAVLWVTSNVVDDVARFDLNSASNVGLYSAILQNASDSVSIITKGISSQTTTPVVYEDSVRCLQSWIWFAQKNGSKDLQVVRMLRPLVTAIIASLHTEPLNDVSVELLADTLSNYPGLFTEDDYQNLANSFLRPWFHSRYEKLLQGDFDFDFVRLGQLLLAFGEARVEILVRGTSGGPNHELLMKLCGLLTADGFPVAEDRIFVPAIEFWSTFAETMADLLDTSEDSTGMWASYALPSILEAVSNAWRKITYPPADEFSQWDSSDRVAFNDARKDVVDLLQSVYTLAGSRLAITFVELTLSALSISSWLPLEAAAYCLGGLAECNREDEQFDAALSSVFASSLFSVLENERAQMPTKTRQTCLSLIEKYTDYFESHITFLPSALRLLFAMLGEQPVAISASKSILRLCSSCRHHLHPEIDALLDQYQKLVKKQQIDCVSSEKIIGAIASVAQAIPEPHRRNAAYARILGLVQADVLASEELLVSPDVNQLPCALRPRCVDGISDEHPGLHVALRALRCLISVGKGFQAPSEAPIDLEAAVLPPESNVDIIQLQQQVISMIHHVEITFTANIEITELICSSLRCGFSENDPGPFVLPPKDVAHYLTNHAADTPGIGAIVRTACSFISSASVQRNRGNAELLSSILVWVIGLLKQLPEPGFDSELAQNGIEFVSRLFTKSPSTLLRFQPPEAAEYFFMFALQVLDGREPLPKAAAAEFWSTFLGFKHDELELQEAVKQAMNMLGPLVSQSLARNIGGNASRSELDKLSEPLKKLVSRHVRSRDWFLAALNDQSFPSAKVNADQKAMFVKRIFSLRGSRATNQVVRDFWLLARGASFTYVS